jgi:hypothetical protein
VLEAQDVERANPLFCAMTAKGHQLKCPLPFATSGLPLPAQPVAATQTSVEQVEMSASCQQQKSLC